MQRSTRNARSNSGDRSLVPPTKTSKLAHGVGMEDEVSPRPPAPSDALASGASSGASIPVPATPVLDVVCGDQSLSFPPHSSRPSFGPEATEKSSDPTDIQKLIDQSLEAHGETLIRTTKSFCRQVTSDICGKLEQRIAGVERGVDDLGVAVDGIKKGQVDLAAKMEALSKQMEGLSASRSSPNLRPWAGGEQPTDLPPPSRANNVTVSGFWREPNPCILLVNVHDRIDVSAKNMESAVVPLLEDANIDPAKVQIRGDQLDSRFDITFPDPQSCRQFFSSLLLGRGQYKKTEVISPSGESVQFYFNPDKNAATVRREVQAKQLANVLAPLVADVKLTVRKNTGSVIYRKSELAAVVVESDTVTKVGWNRPLAATLHLNTDEIEAAFVVESGGLSFS